MTARQRTAGRTSFVSVVLQILTMVLMAGSGPACSGKEVGPRVGNLRLTIQQTPAPIDIDLGDIDSLLVTIMGATDGQVDSTYLISPPPPSFGGVMLVDLELPSAADRSVVVRASGGRPVGGAAVTIPLSPFVAAFQSVQFMDDGARHRIFWNRVPGATRWRLSIREDAMPLRDTLLVDTTFAATRLPVAYQVIALDATAAAGAPGDILEPGLLLPGVPVNLRLTPRSGERVDVRWATGGGFVAAWELERRAEEAGFLPRVTLAVDTTSFADTTVVDGRRFEYRVRARNSRGVSGWTNSVAAVAPLNEPSDMVLTRTDLEIALGWVDRSLSETSYEVERANGGGGFGPLVTLSVNASGWVDAPLAENTRYRYRVRTVRGLLESRWSDVVEATTPLFVPSSPGGLLAQAITPSQINLGWGPARGIVAGYEIERRVPGGEFGYRDTVAGDIVVYADFGLAPATTLEYRVRARNASGAGAWSNVAAATTFPAPR